MRMHAALTRGLVLPLVLLGLLATAPLAHAIIGAHAGAICKAYNHSDVPFIDSYTDGIRSSKGSPTNVTCPLTRNTSSSLGAIIYVAIKHVGTQTTQCSAYSYGFDGSLLASDFKTLTGSGYGTLTFNLSTSNAYSSYSVLCSIPGDDASVLHEVVVDEK